MKKHFPEALNLFDFPNYWNDARVALTSLPGLVGLDGPTSFYNPQQCVHDPNDIGSKGFDYAS